MVSATIQQHRIYRATAKELAAHGAKFTLQGLRHHFTKLNEYTNPTGGGLNKIPLNTIPWERRCRDQYLTAYQPIANPLDEWEQIRTKPKSEKAFLSRKTQSQVANHLLGIGSVAYWTGSKMRSTLLGLDVDDHESAEPDRIQKNSCEAINLFIEMTGWTPMTCPSQRGIHGFLILDKGWLTAQATNEMWQEIVRLVHAEAKIRGLAAKLECKGKARIITADFAYGGVLLKDPFTGMNPTDQELNAFWSSLEGKRITDVDLRDKLTTLANSVSISAIPAVTCVPLPSNEQFVVPAETLDAGTWVKKCRKWAVNGLVEDDSMPEVVFELSKWLYFVELWELNEDDRFKKVVHVLQQFCLNKNNGFITRFNQGDSQDVMSHVERIVQSMVQRITDSAQSCFQRIREKRKSGRYSSLWLLESSLLSQSYPLSSVKLNICCSVCDEEKKTKASPQDWIYIPDLTPLPEQLKTRIREVLKSDGAKSKTFDKLVGFLNHLKSKNGEARLGVKSLKKMGFSDHRARQHISTLREMGLLIEKSGSPVAGLGKMFVLTSRARELLGMSVFDPDRTDPSDSSESGSQPSNQK